MPVIQPAAVVVVLTVLLSTAAGCSQGRSTAPVPPLGPTAPVTPSPPQPAPDPSSTFDLAGSVFEGSADAPRPMRSPRVFFSYRRPGENYWTGTSTQGDDGGRFMIPHVLYGTYMKVWTWAGNRVQPCASNLTVTGPASLKLEVAAPGAAPSNPVSPTLSGTVYETTPQGRQPLGGAQITYAQGCSGMFDINSRLDSEGRYFFCNLPRGSGCVTVYVPTDDFDTVDRPIPVVVSGDRVLDLDVKR